MYVNNSTWKRQQNYSIKNDIKGYTIIFLIQVLKSLIILSLFYLNCYTILLYLYQLLIRLTILQTLLNWKQLRLVDSKLIN